MIYDMFHAQMNIQEGKTDLWLLEIAFMLRNQGVIGQIKTKSARNHVRKSFVAQKDFPVISVPIKIQGHLPCRLSGEGPHLHHRLHDLRVVFK